MMDGLLGIQAVTSIPHTIGTFRILVEVDRTVHGMLYTAQHVSSEELVRLLVLPQSSSPSKLNLRLSRERKLGAASLIRMPGILPIRQWGRFGDGCYAAMQWPEARNLNEWVWGGVPKSPLTEMLLLQQVAAILDNAHASGLWHGGLNPRNVFVGPAGEVRIADLFGFPLDPDELMGNPAVVNELAYIAPEQWMGCAAGAASDQFALAVMAFRMLSGSLPFEAKSADRMMDLASQFDPLPLHRVNAGISVHASTVFRRAFSRRPADRYPSCMALTESILTAIEQGPDGRNCF